jgi:hypothetical protein
VYCGLSGAATSSGALTLRCPNRVDGELHWSRAGDALQLAGTFAGYPVTANARLLKPSDYRLLSTHFRWIMDR